MCSPSARAGCRPQGVGSFGCVGGCAAADGTRTAKSGQPRASRPNGVEQRLANAKRRERELDVDEARQHADAVLSPFTATAFEVLDRAAAAAGRGGALSLL